MATPIACSRRGPLVGAPEDAADLVAFLVSDRARWITGALVPLDGGRALTSLR